MNREKPDYSYTKGTPASARFRAEKFSLETGMEGGGDVAVLDFTGLSG
jgi:hypothetical protein